MKRKILEGFILISKVLVVDDDIMFCNAMKYHLLQREYNVDICISHDELQNKDIEEFDLILLDMRLKDAEGLDILQSILEVNPAKKIIIVSSYLDDKSILKINELGAYKWIHKSSRLFEELDLIMKQI